MSADSLNGSPLKKVSEEAVSPNSAKTYTICDDENSNCERVSQVSPCILSPTADASAPDNSHLNAAISTSVNTKSDINDSTKNTQTKDLAYGTLGSGMLSLSNCATELHSCCDDTSTFPQPELVRRSSMSDMVNITPPTKIEDRSDISPLNLDKLISTPKLNKIDSVEITCCKDLCVLKDSPNTNFKDITNTTTSTPVTEPDDNCREMIPCTFSKIKNGEDEISAISLSNLKETTPNNSISRKADSGTSGILESSYQMYDKETDNPEKSETNSKNFNLFIQSIITRPQNSTFVNDKSKLNPENDMVNSMVIEAAKIQDNSNTKETSENTDSLITVDTRSQDLSDDYNNTKDEVISNAAPRANVDDGDDSLKAFQTFLDSAKTTPQDKSIKSETQQTNNTNTTIPISNLEMKTNDSETSLNSLTKFQLFFQSAEIRPQDISKNHSSENSDGDNHILSQNSNADSLAVSIKTFSYSDFENSASSKPQDIQSFDKSTPSEESGVGSEGFRNFEALARNWPQDMLSLIDESSMLLSSERTLSEHAINSFMNRNIETPSTSKVRSESSVIINPSFTSFRDSPEDYRPNIFITESPLLAKINRSQTLDSLGECPVKSGDSKDDRNEIDGDVIKASLNLSNNDLDKSFVKEKPNTDKSKKCNGGNQVFATVHFINEPFEELLESNVDASEVNLPKGTENESPLNNSKERSPINDVSEHQNQCHDNEKKVTEVTQDFLQNENNFCQFDAYFPFLSDIIFTESPTEPTSPECERDSATDKDKPSELAKEWDGDTDSHFTNSSSGEFLRKDGDGHETALVPNMHFQHQHDSSQPSRAEVAESNNEASFVVYEDSGSRSECSGESGSRSECSGESGSRSECSGESGSRSECSGESGSGSEGDEVEFDPPSWDCRAVPSKSSLKSSQQPADGKKRVMFKREKYRYVYVYARESSDLDEDSPDNYSPDLSSYCESDPRSAEEAEVGYGQSFRAPSPLDMFPLRAGIAFGAVMSDETPVMMTLPMSKRDDPMPEPTFSTFGNPTCKSTADQKNIVLTDNPENPDMETDNPEEETQQEPEIKEEDEKADKGPVKESTVLDSGDEDSDIESRSKAILERKPADVS